MRMLPRRINELWDSRTELGSLSFSSLFPVRNIVLYSSKQVDKYKAWGHHATFFTPFNKPNSEFFFHLTLTILFLYWKGKLTEKERQRGRNRSFSHPLTSYMTLRARVRPGQHQEPEASSHSYMAICFPGCALAGSRANTGARHRAVGHDVLISPSNRTPNSYHFSSSTRSSQVWPSPRGMKPRIPLALPA